MPATSKYAAVGLMLFAAASCSTTADVPADGRFGVQLYSVRDDMARDPLGTIDRVDRLGYESVELAGFFGAEPAEICRRAQAANMRVAAVHADWKLLRDDPAAVVAQARAACSATVILAWLPPEERQTLAQWRWWIAHLNSVASQALKQGLAVAYHAHDFEFAPIDGTRPIDLLMRELDPSIGFELDTYWLAKAGIDPLEFMRAHADRISHIHLKDIDQAGAMATVGAGRLDFPAIVAEARRRGVRHLIVEHDDAADPWASLAASLDYLRSMPLQR